NVFEQSPEERRTGFVKRVNNAAPIFRHLLTMPQPVVASVRGACAGAAVGFVSCCDFILASETALFLVAHVHIGASPDGATTYALPRKVGTAKAMEMALLGGKVSAQEARTCGLVNQLHTDEELDAAVEKLVQQIVALPASSVRNIKSLINQSLNNNLERQLELEAQAFADCAASPNFIEGVSAFLEKRKAKFNM
ncbi:MAG TPA: enoyl-CoA hydratase-related protein, partial [Xanthomonadales bacterium]|nr:enoyl-CoA hydratase-related protein [Xanthomonadales bacterium]